MNLPRVVEFLVGHGAKIELWNTKDKYGWTPLLIAEGFRPGGFKPSFETIAAIQGDARIGRHRPASISAEGVSKPAILVHASASISPSDGPAWFCAAERFAAFRR
ncbi:MAG: hypothetical protein U1G07_05295 [Verrucomicrobiota bacterium]